MYIAKQKVQNKPNALLKRLIFILKQGPYPPVRCQTGSIELCQLQTTLFQPQSACNYTNFEVSLRSSVRLNISYVSDMNMCLIPSIDLISTPAKNFDTQSVKKEMALDSLFVVITIFLKK